MRELAIDMPRPPTDIASRRRSGVTDARHGRPPASSDLHYMEGYRLAERLRSTLPPLKPEAPSIAEEPIVGLGQKEKSQAERDSFALARYMVLCEADIASDTWQSGAAITVLKQRLSQIRKLVLAGDLEGLRAITAPTEAELKSLEDVLDRD